ncbi:four helix bundle protein [Brevundimonas sp. VNH65]|uniref:four helix bundle protein n=1 Tax=Brevundimonas sp. VNH65 TaxID=3400917 RepID=UPI003BFC0456
MSNELPRSHRDLKLWQISLDVTETLYRVTAGWPKHEQYGLISQVRRAAVSVPANVAEGAGRRTPGEFAHFVGIARGSLAELETLLIVARRLDYLDEPTYRAILNDLLELGRMTTGLLRSLEERR